MDYSTHFVGYIKNIIYKMKINYKNTLHAHPVDLTRTLVINCQQCFFLIFSLSSYKTIIRLSIYQFPHERCSYKIWNICRISHQNDEISFHLIRYLVTCHCIIIILAHFSTIHSNLISFMTCNLIENELNAKLCLTYRISTWKMSKNIHYTISKHSSNNLEFFSNPTPVIKNETISLWCGLWHFLSHLNKIYYTMI